MITGPANYSVDHISVPACAALKIKLSSCWSIDCYDTNPGSQDTYYNSHKITFSFWRKWIGTPECGILAIKKTSVKTLQVELYSDFLSVSIKHVQEKEKRKELIVTEKEHFFFLTSFQLQHWKTSIMIFYFNFFFFELISILVNSIYFLFLSLENTGRDMNW